MWWLGVLGLWDLEVMEPGKEHVTIAVSGSHGGFTIDFRELAHRGVTLVGLTEAFKGKTVYFQDDLNRNILDGDTSYFSLLDAADEYIRRNGLDLPEEPKARKMLPDPECMIHPIREIDMTASQITSIIWATGFLSDYGWLQVDALTETVNPLTSAAFVRARGLFCGITLAVPKGFVFYLGGMARRKTYRRPYCDPTTVCGLLPKLDLNHLI